MARATRFADDVKKVPPFIKDGKEAVRVHVYKCKDGKKFVAYLERLTPESKKALDAFNSKDPKTVNPGDAANIGMMMQEGVEYKKPGDKQWVRMSTNFSKFQELMTIRCPNPEDPPQRVDP